MAEVMAAAAQYVEPEQQEVLETGLQRPPQYHHHHTTITAADMPEKSVFLDNHQGEKVEWSISGANPGILQDLDAKLVDSDIGKVLNAFINAQDDEIRPHGANTSREREVTNSADEEYEEEEVIELEFERAIKKLDTHTMHCPKCNTQVTKVILRRKRKITPKQPKPLSLLGCLPCLSVFIPSGNYFNMFGLFGTDQRKKPQGTPSLGESIPPADATTAPSIIPTDNGNVVIQEKGGCFGLFGIFRKNNDSESVKEPLLTSTEDSSDSPSQPEHVDGNKVQAERDQGQFSKQKDESATGSSSYLNGGLKDQGQNSKQKDEASTGSSNYLNGGLKDQGQYSEQKDEASTGSSNYLNGGLKDQGQYSEQKDEASTGSSYLNGGLKDQGQYSEQKDEASTGSSNYKSGGLKGKHVVGTPPQGVILPGDVRLDIEDESDVSKLLGKPSGKTGDGKPEGDYGSCDGAALLGEQTGVVGLPARHINNQDSKSFEIVKSIVYGGLMEAITSLSVVASAVASDVTTLNILALGLATVVGGIFILGHNIWDLKDDHRSNPRGNRYKELLGRRENFPLHVTFAVLSFLIFGLVSPVTYGFAFRVSDNKDYKILTVAGAALLSVVLLGIGKAYALRTPKFYLYLKTIMYYVTIAFAASGFSYAAGHLVRKLVDDLGLFDTNSPAAALSFPVMNPASPVLASY